MSRPAAVNALAALGREYDLHKFIPGLVQLLGWLLAGILPLSFFFGLCLCRIARAEFGNALARGFPFFELSPVVGDFSFGDDLRVTRLQCEPRRRRRPAGRCLRVPDAALRHRLRKEQRAVLYARRGFYMGRDDDQFPGSTLAK